MNLEGTSRVVGNIKVMLSEGTFPGKFAHALAEAVTWAEDFQKSIDAERATHEQTKADQGNQHVQDAAGVGSPSPDNQGGPSDAGGKKRTRSARNSPRNTPA